MKQKSDDYASGIDVAATAALPVLSALDSSAFHACMRAPPPPRSLLLQSSQPPSQSAKAASAYLSTSYTPLHLLLKDFFLKSSKIHSFVS
jgi:hypothetical protein